MREFEAYGKPAIAVVTEPFLEPAQLTAQGLGMPDVSIIAVPHPLSDANDAASKGLAAVPKALDILVS